MRVQLLRRERSLRDRHFLQFETDEFSTPLEQEPLELCSRQWLVETRQKFSKLCGVQLRVPAHLELPRWWTATEAPRFVLWLEERVD